MYEINDRTNVSFGRLSDPGVLQHSPLASARPELQYFNSQNFQYIVDNIADMFGLAKGTIQVGVIEKDYMRSWLDFNQNDEVEEDEILFRFVMNAAINTYNRRSFYGKHYMYNAAMQHGYPVIFGIAAHEVGHLINRYVMYKLDTKFIGTSQYLVETEKLNDRWDELCADYLAGVVLAKAMPRLNHEPLKDFLSGTKGDEAHSDGFWRVFAVEMGYQWGCYNDPVMTSQILSNKESLRQLLVSFYQAYYQQVFCGVDLHTRSKYSGLSPYMLESCSTPIAKL